MGERVPKVLRRWLTRAEPSSEPQEPVEQRAVSTASTGREIEFWAYGEDCRLYGFLQLEAERLSDLLNTASELELNSVLVVALEDNRAIEFQRLIIHADDLVAVRGSGPRGNAGRRTRTRPAPVALKAGPYIIRGYVHTPPGADPLSQFRRRKRMVPLTEASIEYTSDGLARRARVGTLIVNRELVEWVDHAKDTEVRVDLPIEMRIDPRAKDLTGQIRVFRDEPRDTSEEPAAGPA